MDRHQCRFSTAATIPSTFPLSALNKLFDASFIKSGDAPEYCAVGVRMARIPPSRHFNEGLQGFRPQPLEQLRRLGTSQHHHE
jgi:hypothetical protein